MVVHACSPRMWEVETRGSDQEFKITLSLYETLKGPEAWETRCCPAELRFSLVLRVLKTRNRTGSLLFVCLCV